MKLASITLYNTGELTSASKSEKSSLSSSRAVPPRTVDFQSSCPWYSQNTRRQARTAASSASLSRLPDRQKDVAADKSQQWRRVSSRRLPKVNRPSRRGGTSLFLEVRHCFPRLPCTSNAGLPGVLRLTSECFSPVKRAHLRGLQDFGTPRRAPILRSVGQARLAIPYRTSCRKRIPRNCSR